MIRTRMLYVIIIWFLFLGANWVLIDVLPRQIIHALMAPTGDVAPMVRAVAAPLSAAGASGVFR